ncbi:MAG: aminotransferase class III [Spirochaetes bacterium GWF1_41_5]|nr:MAG: aminotransferase class III [Spirochaetes bacterium GWF1_41_5]HBE02342.1 aminotransferase class III [Spirochaetia bacterium]
MGKSQDYYKKAKKIIPGGTQLLSKKPELFLPDYWPAYYQKAGGCIIHDLDNKKYIDMITMGIGSCILGYADPDVEKAVISAVKNGSMSSLNCYEELELAQLLIELHPWAEMVRYARSGGEAMSVAVRIARAYSKKDKVLLCGYHGWHDWYISANLNQDKALDGHLLPGLKTSGIPRALTGLTLTFHYNDTEAFLKLFARHKNEIGAIVLETIRNEEPDRDFISAISKTAQKNHVPFIVDEITSGWRLNTGGAHLLYGITPDIAVFAKGMSNGYPMAAVIGSKKVMDSAQDSFISSTYWTERIGPAAALATIRKMKKLNVQKFITKTGKTIQQQWKELAERYKLKIKVSGIYPLSHFQFDYQEHAVLKTLFTQLMLEKGFLASTVLYTSYAHKEQYTAQYFQAVNIVFKTLSEWLKLGNLKKHLKGPVCHSGFQRLN